MHSVSKHMRLSVLTKKICIMRIDLHFQRQRYSLMTLVSGNYIKICVDIRGGSFESRLQTTECRFSGLSGA